MPGLTPQVWDKLERRPAIMAFRPQLLELQLALLRPPVDTIVPPFPAEKLIGHLCYGFPYADAVAQVREQLDRIRLHFGLEEGVPLRVAIMGNESRMAVIAGAGDAQDSEGFGAFMIREAVSERTLGGHVEAALQRLDDVVFCPLNELPGAAKPRLDCPRSYQRLVRKVRAEIDKIPVKLLARKPETLVKLPAAVRLYVRKRRWSRWRPLILENPPRAHVGEADLLIDAFSLLRYDARETNRRPPEGVLVKVIGTDASRHCIADLPMLTADQHDRAREAGIEAVVLDARGVIWNVPGEPLDKRASPPVYGA
jgi:hypothetical protein